MITLKILDVSISPNPVDVGEDFEIVFKVEPTEIGILSTDNRYILTALEIPILIENEYVGE